MLFRTGHISLSAIKAMELRASKVPDVVSLAQGIPSFDTPEVIRAAAIEAIQRGQVARYSLTMGLPELREVVSQRLRAEGMHYDYDTEIIVTCGAIEGITASLLALLSPGDEVLIPSPTYASYPQAVKVAGGVPVFFPLHEGSGWTLDVQAIADRITKKTRAIFFSNPNNPTGTVYSKEQLLEIGRLAEQHNLVIITDEVYRDFLYSDQSFFTLAEMPKLRDRVIRIFSFSKAYAMTGWRIGFVHSSADNIREILKVHDSLVTCAPVVSQYAAMAAFRSADDSVLQFCDAYRARRDLICDRLDGLSRYMTYQRPTSSYFVFPRLLSTVASYDQSEQFCHHLLEEARVAVVPGSAFGPTGEEHVRLSFGRTEEDINRALDRMGEYLTERRAVAIPKSASGSQEAMPRRPVRGLARRIVAAILARQAQVYLWRTKPDVIAVVGSVNKARTREYIQHILSGTYDVRPESKGYNTDIGLPLAILDLPTGKRSIKQWVSILLRAERMAWLTRTAPKVLVLEYGIDRSGDMKQLLWITKPKFVVFTELKPSYTQAPQYLDTIAHEYEQLVRRVPTDGTVVLNAGDRRITALRDQCSAVVVTYGMPSGVHGSYDATTEQVTIKSGEDSVTVQHALTGDSELKALLAAVACARAYGMTLHDIAARLTVK